MLAPVAVSLSAAASVSAHVSAPALVSARVSVSVSVSAFGPAFMGQTRRQAETNQSLDDWDRLVVRWTRISRDDLKKAHARHAQVVRLVVGSGLASKSRHDVIASLRDMTGVMPEGVGFWKGEDAARAPKLFGMLLFASRATSSRAHRISL